MRIAIVEDREGRGGLLSGSSIVVRIGRRSAGLVFPGLYIYHHNHHDSYISRHPKD